LSAERSYTVSDGIYDAKRLLRKRTTEDFGYSIRGSNYRRN